MMPVQPNPNIAFPDVTGPAVVVEVVVGAAVVVVVVGVGVPGGRPIERPLLIVKGLFIATIHYPR
jgi:hypothetical protein